ncbi:MAG: RpiB/LacA/LacB family sugar-phosphate isomerase [Patescibacteria group bacterium]
MKVYLGADHRGFALKEKIKDWLTTWGYEFSDLGAYQLDPQDDFTLYAEKVGVVVGREEGARGILLCGSGVGVNIAANKIDGVRASFGLSPEQVKAGRNDDDMNILVIAADFVAEEKAKDLIKVFLETKFAREERFVRRLAEIKKLEANN